MKDKYKALFSIVVFIILVALWLGFLSLLPLSLIFWNSLSPLPDNGLFVLIAVSFWALSMVYWFFVVCGGFVLPILMPILWCAKVAFSIGNAEKRIEWERKWGEVHSDLAKEDAHNW